MCSALKAQSSETSNCQYEVVTGFEEPAGADSFWVHWRQRFHMRTNPEFVPGNAVTGNGVNLWPWTGQSKLEILHIPSGND